MVGDDVILSVGTEDEVEAVDVTAERLDFDVRVAVVDFVAKDLVPHERVL